MMRLAIPNRGRLHQDGLRLVHQALGLQPSHPRQLIFGSPDSGVEVVCVRSTDIPWLLCQRVVDLGLTGNDYVLESGFDNHLSEVVDLEICPGALCMLVGNQDECTFPANLPADVVVASQYPNITERLLRPQHPDFCLLKIDGGAEAYPTLGLARSILDVVASGETAAANNLRVIQTYHSTSARLYQDAALPANKSREVETLANTLLGTM